MKSFSGLSDPGLVRSANQDAYWIDAEGRFFIVADGMGGHAGGQEASHLAIQTLQTYFVEHWSASVTPETLLEEAFLRANQAILQDQEQHAERADMGTTAVAVVFRAEQPWCVHVGDSRLYRLRDRKLEQITEDHTWVAQAVKGGQISTTQSQVHPWRHILAQCLGREDLKKIEIQPFTVQAGDRLLLCSDGLTEELSDSLISAYLESSQACEKVAAALVKAAKDQGGRDNITVVIVTIDEASPNTSQAANLATE